MIWDGMMNVLRGMMTNQQGKVRSMLFFNVIYRKKNTLSQYTMRTDIVLNPCEGVSFQLTPSQG